MSRILALVLLLGFPLSIETELQGQSIVARLSSNSQVLPEINAANSTPAYSYLTRIPFVTAETGFRTNVGLNNFSKLSFVKGANPGANVRLTLVDQQGHVAGQGTYAVGSNGLLQINNIISALGGNVSMGWLEVLSDEPLTAWASVIFNSSNDPSIELATRFGGQRLMIESSVKTDPSQSSLGTFQSSLVVVNIGSKGGDFAIKIYDHDGKQIGSNTVFIEQFGMYIDNDIRNSVPGTFGEIVIEASDPSVLLMANSIVKSANGTGAFFPAFPLPPASSKSVAGIWEGSVTGTVINAQVRVTLYQEGTSLFGKLEITSGSFPTASKSFSISGFVSNDGTSDKYFIQANADILDSSVGSFSFILNATPITGTKMQGKFVYFDGLAFDEGTEPGHRDTGPFSLGRTGHILPESTAPQHDLTVQ